MIKLFVFNRAFGSVNPGPFATKLELALRLLELDHEVHFNNDPRQGPKGKIPFIEYQGRRIGDSELILNWIAEEFGKDLNEGLSPLELAQCTAYRALLEDRLYWGLVHSRWMSDDVFPHINEAFFAAMPWPLRKIVPAVARRQVRRDLKGQGTGLLTREERISIAKNDIQAVAEQIGDKPWFFGDRPSRADLYAYGQLACIALPEFDTPLKRMVLGHSNLCAYVNRISKSCFSDLSLNTLK